MIVEHPAEIIGVCVRQEKPAIQQISACVSLTARGSSVDLMAAERPAAGVRTVNSVTPPPTFAPVSHPVKERPVEQTAAVGPAESAIRILCVKMASALNVFLTVNRF